MKPQLNSQEINGQTHYYSVLILRPKPAFFAWLSQVASSRGTTADDLYDPCEDGVWLIPNLSRIPDGLTNYLDKIKVSIAEYELGSFGDIPEHQSRDELFDLFFDYDLRAQPRVAPSLQDVGLK